MANCGDDLGLEPITGTVNQDMLAALIGTTPCFFHDKLKQLGFTNYNGKLEVQKDLLNFVLHNNHILSLELRSTLAPARYDGDQSWGDEEIYSTALTAMRRVKF